MFFIQAKDCIAFLTYEMHCAHKVSLETQTPFGQSLPDAPPTPPSPPSPPSATRPPETQWKCLPDRFR